MTTLGVILRAAVIGGVLFIGAGAGQQTYAQAGSSLPDPAVPCEAFQRFGNGSWTAIRPVTLDFGGIPMSFGPGDTFPVGTTTNGVAVPVILDRQCGNI
jgi:hypothetical protein